MKTFGFLVIIKQGFSTTSLEKLKSWIRIYTPIRRFVNILTTFLCPSFTCFAHVLMLRNITASLIRGLWLKWQTCLWLSESQAETLAGRQYMRRKPEVEECVAKDSIRVFGYTGTETYLENGGTRWRSWLGHGATIRKVAGSLTFFIDVILLAALLT